MDSPKNHFEYNLVKFSGFDYSFADFYSKGEDAVQILNEKKHSIKETEQTYRVINHWESLGLINNSREDNKLWRKFSFLELVWIHIIQKLRIFGFPLDKLKKVKEKLFDEPGKDKVHYAYFEYYICRVLTGKPVYIIVFEDGTTDIGETQEIEYTRPVGLGDHIEIQLNRIVQTIKGSIKPLNFDFGVKLTREELALVESVRFGDFESIKIKLSDGKIELLEKTKSIDVTARINDILKMGNYQDIVIMQQDGKKVCIKQTEKTRFKAME